MKKLSVQTTDGLEIALQQTSSIGGPGYASDDFTEDLIGIKTCFFRVPATRSRPYVAEQNCWKVSPHFGIAESSTWITQQYSDQLRMYGVEKPKSDAANRILANLLAMIAADRRDEVLNSLQAFRDHIECGGLMPDLSSNTVHSGFAENIDSHAEMIQVLLKEYYEL